MDQQLAQQVKGFYDYITDLVDRELSNGKPLDFDENITRADDELSHFELLARGLNAMLAAHYSEHNVSVVIPESSDYMQVTLTSK